MLHIGVSASLFTPPSPGLNQADNFSVRFYGSIVPTTTASYRLWTNSDDGVILWWYSGGTWQKLIDNPNTYVGQAYTNYFTLTAGQRYPIVLDYFEIGGNANIQLQWQLSTSSSVVTIPQANLSTSIAVDLPDDGACPAGAAPTGGISPLAPVCQISLPPSIGNGLRADYYNGINFNTYIGTRYENINFNWGGGSLGMAGVGADNFSIVWSGSIWIPNNPALKLCFLTDDGIRVRLNGTILLNSWSTQAATLYCTQFIVNANQNSPVDVPIEIAYFENTGNAEVSLLWQIIGSSGYIPVTIHYLSSPTVLPSPVYIPPSPNIVPFTTMRLQAIAQNNPQIVFPSMPPPAPGTIQWNSRVGRFFQSAVLQLIGAPENGGNLFTNARRNAPPVNLNRPGAVRPDAILTARFLDLASNPPTLSLLTGSLYIEVKAVNGAISMSYDRHQLTGFKDAILTYSTAGQQFGTGIINYITTANTVMAPDVINPQSYPRVVMCHTTVWEIQDPNNPYDPIIFMAPTVLLNPQVSVMIYPLDDVTCRQFSGQNLRLSVVNSSDSALDDPDPAVLVP
jgi:hypothetical protein